MKRYNNAVTDSIAVNLISTFYNVIRVDGVTDLVMNNFLGNTNQIDRIAQLVRAWV